MKRFLFRLLGFTCFAACCYIGLLFVIGRYAPESADINLLFTLRDGYSDTHARLKEASQARDVQVLVLGSSHAYRGYDPRIFLRDSIRIFNLGSSGQTPLQTEVLVSKYLDSLHPRSVLFDVNPVVLSGDGAESVIDILQNTSIDGYVLRMALKVNNLRVYNSLVYCEMRQLLGMNEHIPAGMSGGMEKYISGGFVETYLPYTPSITVRGRRAIVSPDQLRALDRILAVLKHKGIPYVLVQAPITVRAYTKRGNNEEMDSLFASRGIYYNFNKLLHLPDSMFYNDEHLNQKGVEAYNKKLLELVYRRENKNAGKL